LLNEKPVKKITYEGCCQKWQIGWVGEWVKLTLKASTHLLKDLCANIFRFGLDLMYYYSLRLLPLRCFDFDNYVDINSRRPSWHCPLCGQSVCFTDIRIDQGMVKVLKEVGENVSHVKLFGDGSRFTFDERDDYVNKPKDKPHVPQESTTSIADPNVIILTEGDNDMDKNPNQVDKNPTPA
nr:E4 SUMO-protein ligase PIAL2-like isoform X1 [Tanacetum cinerariifolium]